MDRITHVFTTTVLLTVANLMVAITRSPADIQPNVTARQHSSPQSIVARKGRELIARTEDVERWALGIRL